MEEMKNGWRNEERDNNAMCESFPTELSYEFTGVLFGFLIMN